MSFPVAVITPASFIQEHTRTHPQRRPLSVIGKQHAQKTGSRGRHFNFNSFRHKMVPAMVPLERSLSDLHRKHEEDMCCILVEIAHH